MMFLNWNEVFSSFYFGEEEKGRVKIKWCYIRSPSTHNNPGHSWRRILYRLWILGVGPPEELNVARDFLLPDLVDQLVGIVGHSRCHIPRPASGGVAIVFGAIEVNDG